MGNLKTCILGNGAAAIEAVKSMRESGYTGEICMISDSIWPAFNPMLTTYYVAGRIEFADMFPFGHDGKFYRENNAELIVGSPVSELDTRTNAITLANGKVLFYDKCLIATGATPVMPRIPGIQSDKVFAMRTVEDAIKLKIALNRRIRKAVVVGASMVGIKVVELLLEAGVEVCLADLASCLFPLAAHNECAEIIQETLRNKGVKLKFGAAIERIENKKNTVRAVFKDAGEVDADIVVMCIGVSPNVGFIRKDQIVIDKGIVVDDRMMTNHPDVFAAGDVSQGTNLLTQKKEIIGLWINARYQGRTAGRNMAGVYDTYMGNIPHNITHFMDMVFTGMGDPNYGERHQTIEKPGSYVHLTFDQEHLVGVNMLGHSCCNIGILKSALEKRLIDNKTLDLKGLCSKNLRGRFLYNYFRKQKT